MHAAAGCCHTAGHLQLEAPKGLRLVIEVDEAYTSKRIHRIREGARGKMGGHKRIWQMRGSYMRISPAGEPVPLFSYCVEARAEWPGLPWRSRIGAVKPICQMIRS